MSSALIVRRDSTFENVCISPARATKATASCGSIAQINPLEDARWESFVQDHPRASVFHSSAWLKALSLTYGYEPLAFTTSEHGGNLRDALLFCKVDSWLTGKRLVSLPFSDHCNPLAAPDTADAIGETIIGQLADKNSFRYIEIRPLHPIQNIGRIPHTKVSYAFHELDLRPEIDQLFAGFHHASIQRKIRRAEREGLTVAEGKTKTLLHEFYSLLEATRIRHLVPPQPKRWFENLVGCFGDALTLRVAYQEQRAVAAMMTLRHRDTLVYKYGCSDASFNRLGGIHLLYWHAIQQAKALGLRRFDLGRTDADQRGLITFKGRWGAMKSELTYLRYSASSNATHFFDLPSGNWTAKATQFLMSHMPSPVLSKVGQRLYRHVG